MQRNSGSCICADQSKHSRQMYLLRYVAEIRVCSPMTTVKPLRVKNRTCGSILCRITRQHDVQSGA